MRIVALSIGICLSVVSLSQAQNVGAMLTGKRTPAPGVWDRFCATYPSECRVWWQEPERIEDSAGNLMRLSLINTWVNRHVVYRSDKQHWGVDDQWNFAEDGFGDCEDYALLKKRIATQNGFPQAAFSIVIGRDELGEGHAVLSVATTKGDLLLDNRTNAIRFWWQAAGYTFVMRQSAFYPNRWVEIDQLRLSQLP